ncbi:rCG21747 [Rattus norvegicus]|uniref:RCG21747 n=1 Tax=Rattus norvegicus TaxID=10116 RepID=A6J236_RAT|nr:rCG21747 [Rattus norvegicus]
MSLVEVTTFASPCAKPHHHPPLNEQTPDVLIPEDLQQRTAQSSVRGEG